MYWTPLLQIKNKLFVPLYLSTIVFINKLILISNGLKNCRSAQSTVILKKRFIEKTKCRKIFHKNSSRTVLYW